MPKFSLFVNIGFSDILKTDLIRKIFEKIGNFCSQTVDKTEKVKNNEIKILV